jgi:hypothetical protein
MPKWLEVTLGLLLLAGAMVSFAYLPEWASFLLVAAVLAASGFAYSKRRKQEAHANASRLGFAYVGDGSYENVGPFALLGYPTTIGPGLFNLSRGRYRDLDVGLVDYSHEFNQFTTAVITGPGADLPHFAVQPPSIRAAGPGQTRHYRPVLSRPFDFDGHPEFGRLYWATGEDLAGREVFTPALLDRLTREPGWYLEGMGDRLLVMKTVLQPNGRSRFVTQDELPAFLDDAVGFFRLVADRRGYVPQSA